MTIVDRFLALISAFAYALRRSKFAFLRLHLAMMAVCLLIAGYAAYQGWQEGVTLAHVALILLCLLLLGLMLWADTHRYLVFKPRVTAVPEGTKDLAPEERIFVRGSGVFEVSDMQRYLVEVPVVFWSTQLNEHVLAAKVRAWNVMGLGVPTAERGWWYIFIDPRKVAEIEPGEICFGWRLRPAVRLLIKTGRGQEMTYLSCESVQQLAILLKELQGKTDALHSRHRLAS
jgi:hypothetical protein